MSDPEWPRASVWLASGKDSGLRVIGAPAARGSITPGRCDLAPAAIRSALQRYSTGDLATARDLVEMPVFDAGDLAVAELTPADAFPIIRDAAATAPAAAVTILLGGDNSITRPGVHALGAPLQRCGLITLDAHFDLRSLEGGLTNGNPIRALLEDGLPGRNIVQIGLQSFANSAPYARVAREADISVIPIEQFTDRTVSEALHRLNSQVDAIYVDFDIDVLDRAFAPACPGSRPGGMTPLQLRHAARVCGHHSKVRIADFVEIDPTRDVADITVLTAAVCVLEFAAGVLERG